ncbi:MAG TPA: hypothetical protein VFQ45_09060 [Longimicrobium sp.]|nr:hypothetical protein [Longimicrobium sp.]
MADERRRVPGIGEGIRNGIGLLAAFRDAVEETIQEAVQRGDLSPERARQALGDAFARAQETVGEVRERLSPATQRELDGLRAEVAELRERVRVLEERAGGAAGVARLQQPADPSPPGGEGPLEQRMP